MMIFKFIQYHCNSYSSLSPNLRLLIPIHKSPIFDKGKTNGPETSKRSQCPREVSASKVNRLLVGKLVSTGQGLSGRMSPCHRRTNLTFLDQVPDHAGVAAHVLEPHLDTSGSFGTYRGRSLQCNFFWYLTFSFSPPKT